MNQNINLGVKKLYALGGARWYDWFKNIWNKIVAAPAERELASFLKNNVSPVASILELGCGTALNLEKIAALNLPFKKYLGLDMSPDMLKIAQAKFVHRPDVEFRQQDIQQLDSIKEKFDVILCTWVLSHLPSPATAVNQAQQLLTSGGKMFLIFFSTPKWYIRFWLFPLAKYAFRSKYLSDREVQKFLNVKRMQKYSSNIATFVEIFS